MIKEAYKVLKVVPAVWGTKSTDYIKKEGANALSIKSCFVNSKFRNY